MFQSLPEPKLDALVLVGQAFRADLRADKLDLGVGVYRDADGATPVMATVKAAEAKLQAEQPTKSYLPPDGDPDFAALMQQQVMVARNDRTIAVQAPGGTGAFHQALALLKATGETHAVWVGTPTWPNHIPMLQHHGLRVETYPHYSIADQRQLFEEMLAAFNRAQPGDLVLLHGCCHNPTGADLSPAQWEAAGDIVAEHGLIPLVDFAYQGFGRSSDEDAAGVRGLLKRVPRALIAASCSKSFSLYRERTGILIVQCENAPEAARARGMLQSLARLNYSNPPGHGAAIVRTILSDDGLRSDWQNELKDMRERVQTIRAQLARAGDAHGIDMAFIAEQTGLFATFHMTPEQTQIMGRDHAIHMPHTGRINIAGLTTDTVDRFVRALKQVGVQS
ncbi:MAG: aromatic amino acid transaminase [Sphingorhabdus sp.]